jgi:hypothetical protein
VSESDFDEEQLNQVVQWIAQYCRKNGVNPEVAAAGMSFIDETIRKEAVRRIEEISRSVLIAPEPGLDVLRGENPPTPWYLGPIDNDIFWPSLKDRLEQDGWNSDVLSQLDSSSTKVVANLANPANSTVRTRGLVLGYIQSGKTTNFTAVISKAADAGYRMVIVLSGVSNALRRQTQIRLTAQLLALQPLCWTGLTDEFRDMGRPNQFGFAGLAQPGLRTLAVVKKNPTRLRNLIEFLQKAKDAGALENCPILVIDDEADQASLSPYLTDDKRTTINDLVVKLLKDFPKVAYVAYTATPFANFFVDPSYPENLYPRDFIVSLPEPKAYFGPKQVFGISEHDEPEIDVVRLVEQSENAMMVPPKGVKPEDFQPVLPVSVVDALRWFFLATTVRRMLNGGKMPHSTMMIHTSNRIAQHRNVWKVVSQRLIQMQTSLLLNDTKEIDEFKKLWERESKKVSPTDYGITYPGIGEIISGLNETFKEMGDISDSESESCGLIIDNGAATHRLLYDNEIPKPVIVVGGDTLSRGLTLEGLVSSVFLRSVGLYDTLLQMGRWFGYRPGYEPLPRVWMPEETSERFSHLSRVEIEMREEVEKYAQSNILPSEVGVRIINHPTMKITRAQMMKNVRTVRMSYSGSEVDTAYLFNDRQWLGRNKAAVARLADNCVTSGNKQDTGDKPIQLFKNIDVAAIMDFFNEENGYRVQPAAGARFEEKSVSTYVGSRRKRGELLHWNVAFIGSDRGNEESISPGLMIKTVERGRDPGRTSGSIISIGDHLPSPTHKGIDLDVQAGLAARTVRDSPIDTKSRSALLGVFVVNKDSKAKPGKKRKDLDILEHFYGIMICFPTSGFAGDDDYVVVQIPTPPSDGLDDLEPEIEIDDLEGSADDVVGLN